MLKKSDLAWAAGLFEGEGCICASPNGKQYCPRLDLKMTDQDIVERFAKIVRFGRLNGPYQNKQYKPHWTWNASKHEHVQAIVCFLWSWLGLRRKARIVELFLEFNQGNRQRGRPKIAEEI